jgi:hypothetical protein
VPQCQIWHLSNYDVTDVNEAPSIKFQIENTLKKERKVGCVLEILTLLYCSDKVPKISVGNVDIAKFYKEVDTVPIIEEILALS